MRVHGIRRLHVATLTLAVSYAVLILATAALSLFDFNLFEGRSTFAGVGNYTGVFRDSSFRASLSLTLAYAFVASSLSLGVAGALALGLGRLSLNPIVICIAVLPWFLPPTTVGVLFQLLLDYEQGPLAALLSALSSNGQLNILGTPHGMFWALVLADAWQWIGLLTVAFALLARSSDQSGLDAITVFGGRFHERVFGWWVPVLTSPVIVLAGVKFFWTLADFDRVSTLTHHGGPFGSMRVFGIWVERAYFSFGDFGFGAAATIVVLITALVLSWPLALWVLRKS